VSFPNFTAIVAGSSITLPNGGGGGNSLHHLRVSLHQTLRPHPPAVRVPPLVVNMPGQRGMDVRACFLTDSPNDQARQTRLFTARGDLDGHAALRAVRHPHLSGDLATADTLAVEPERVRGIA